MSEPSCGCCSCTFANDGTRDADPACHAHGVGRHGRRGCGKHNITPKPCTKGCCDHDPVRHAAMLERSERHQATMERIQLFGGEVPVRTDDTPDELAKLQALKARKAAQAAEAQINQMAALMAAVKAREAQP